MIIVCLLMRGTQLHFAYKMKVTSNSAWSLLGVLFIYRPSFPHLLEFFFLPRSPFLNSLATNGQFIWGSSSNTLAILSLLNLLSLLP